MKSKENFPNQVFVTGTDTGVGKTFVSGVLCVGLGASYWKPIQSGLAEQTDSEWVLQFTGIGAERIKPEVFRLTAPLSPHEAAAKDGFEIGLDDFELPAKVEGSPLIVEGAGGVMVPINADCLMIDLIRQFELTTIVVARSSLGTINHTLLTLDALRKSEVNVLGVVMNGEPNSANKNAIEKYGKIPVIAQIPHCSNICPNSLSNLFEECFDPAMTRYINAK